MADTTFGRIAGAVPVSDISRALGFYAGILGMSVTFTNGDPVGFVILKRDAAELHLTLVKGHRAGLHNVAHLMVADAAALHEHLVANGVRIVKGMREVTYHLHAQAPRTPCRGDLDRKPDHLLPHPSGTDGIERCARVVSAWFRAGS